MEAIQPPATPAESTTPLAETDTESETESDPEPDAPPRTDPHAIPEGMVTSYYDALVAGDIPTLNQYWATSEAYMHMGYPQTVQDTIDEPGYEWYFEMGEYCLAVNANATATTATILAKHGHIEALRQARALGCPWDVRVYAQAAARNDIGFMQYAYDNGCPLEPRIGTTHGRIEQALYQNTNWDWSAAWVKGWMKKARDWRHWKPFTGSSSVPNVRTDLVPSSPVAHEHREDVWGDQAGTWADLKEGIWGGNKVCANAAAGGHLEALQWARAHGFPWNASTIKKAAARGHIAILQWARAQDPPCRWTHPNDAFSPARRYSPAVEQWMSEHGRP